MANQGMSGGCLCGAVGVRFTTPVKWVAHCHCSQCQRAHGAAFVTWLGVDAQLAQIQDPHGKLSWFASSDAARRGFCSGCGSSLFFSSSRWAGELHIVRACLHGTLDTLPMAHVFYDTHVDWFSVSDDLPKMTAEEVQ